jgi:hypothetical protein
MHVLFLVFLLRSLSTALQFTCTTNPNSPSIDWAMTIVHGIKAKQADTCVVTVSGGGCTTLLEIGTVAGSIWFVPFLPCRFCAET